MVVWVSHARVGHRQGLYPEPPAVRLGVLSFGSSPPVKGRRLDAEPVNGRFRRGIAPHRSRSSAAACVGAGLAGDRGPVHAGRSPARPAPTQVQGTQGRSCNGAPRAKRRSIAPGSSAPEGEGVLSLGALLLPPLGRGHPLRAVPPAALRARP